MTETSLLVRRLRIDVSANGTSGWTRVNGIYLLNPVIAPVLVNRIAYAGGWANAHTRGRAWSLTLGYTQRADADVRNAAQLLIEETAELLDDDAKLWVRWYDRSGVDDAKQGRAAVTVAPDATGWSNLARQQAVFTGSGPLTDVDNPNA